MVKYSRLDVLSGGTRHPNSNKIKSIKNLEENYQIDILYPDKSIGTIFVNFSETDDIENYLKKMLTFELPDTKYLTKKIYSKYHNQFGGIVGLYVNKYKALLSNGKIIHIDSDKIENFLV